MFVFLFIYLFSVIVFFFFFLKFCQVSALDEDLGNNSQLTYFIEKGNGYNLFSITPSGTFHILHTLDREKESLYIVTITAVDSGNLYPNKIARYLIQYGNNGLCFSNTHFTLFDDDFHCHLKDCHP